MPRNVEIKARVADAAELERRARRISDTPAESLSQEDTFFQVPEGRLKLRVLAPDRGELIYYQREDLPGPKGSSYGIARTEDPGALLEVLRAALPVRGIVRKRRRLYLAGQTRIHLDDVEGLGLFVELEVVLRDDQSLAEGAGTAQAIMTQLGIREENLIKGAYIDLLDAQSPQV